MTGDRFERRYTEQEVALVLQRTAELEERRHRLDASGRGLTQHELETIARDAGFSVDALREVLADLPTREPLRARSLLGPSAVAKRVAAIPGRLADTELPPLIALVEDRVAAAGTVTEAVGVLRWTSVPDGHHFTPITQVSFTPVGAETHIQVSRRYAPPARALVHLLPGAWGAMLGFTIGSSAGLALLPGAVAVAVAAAAGVAVGRGVWQLVARRNHARVAGLAAELVAAAERRANPGRSP